MSGSCTRCRSLSLPPLLLLLLLLLPPLTTATPSAGLIPSLLLNRGVMRVRYEDPSIRKSVKPTPAAARQNTMKVREMGITTDEWTNAIMTLAGMSVTDLGEQSTTPSGSWRQLLLGSAIQGGCERE
jgi:hypothetical protein